MISPERIRVSWLLPNACFYWQPSLSELTVKFSLTKVFTGRWRGFAKGFENKLNVQVVGDRKVIPIATDATGYGNSFTYLSPGVAFPLLKFRPHVVFSSSFGIWTLMALLLKPLGRWRVVIAYEGSSPSVDFKHSRRRLLLRRAMVNAAAACITNSQRGKTYLIETLSATPDSVFDFPYEVPDPRSLLAASPETPEEAPEETPAQPRLPHKAISPTFLFIGSIIPRKGLNCLLQACQQLNQQGIFNYTVLIVGEGSQQAHLERLCHKQNLTQQIQWLGHIPYEQLGQYIQQSDVFVLPTLEDTWGMVVLETMILGKAVLCSTGAGASELVQDGLNGYRFEPEDVARLTQLMQLFINNPKIIAEMGQQSRQIMAQYTPAKAGEFLANVTHFVCSPSTIQEADV